MTSDRIAIFFLGFIVGLIALRIARRLRWSRMPRIPADIPAPLRFLTISQAARDAATLAESPRKAESDFLGGITANSAGWPTPPREDRTPRVSEF